jgi:hypothetical protein
MSDIDATVSQPPDALTAAEQVASKKGGSTAPRRDIPGNLPYLTAHGTLKKVLDKIIEAQRPEKFGVDFLENVLKLTGGSARATIAILKRVGFLASDGTPTELYAKFKTDGGRSSAALQGMKVGFSEIFKRSEYAHVADDNKIRDIIVEITGLSRGDPVATAIRNTFNTFRSYIVEPFETLREAEDQQANVDTTALRQDISISRQNEEERKFNLAYNINIVLPETSDLRVLNAIFKSLKENLLR